ncbi:hypothetical protein HMPREF1981_03185 [Bacteroides pyogenes F0041]|uniref:Uncharacterized protein n=1 Tax=Bacteroides pyogenes F0041 TaxID=1321819 RepID=U2DNZ0_9BACE|nr:hypothetical protein HMPREF1981_03185 [Bacteroides pyogenes F0041]
MALSKKGKRPPHPLLKINLIPKNKKITNGRPPKAIYTGTKKARQDCEQLTDAQRNQQGYL